MANVQFGNGTWPGTTALVAGEYSCDRGTAPGMIRILVPLADEDTIQRYGNFTMFDGNNQITLYDCCLQSGELADGAGGKCIRLTIADRRWKWRFGSFSARYNLRDERGVIIDVPTSPFDIAKAILESMGEKNYDIDLPAGVSLSETPMIEFDNTRPDQALEEIAAKFSRVVVFQPVANRVIIARPGFGKALPALDPKDVSISVTTAEVPSRVEIIGAPIVYMVLFKLIPAAEELDGSIVPIDNVSYRPTAGWTLSRMRAFRDVVVPAAFNADSGISYGVATREEVIARAQNCIWKYFRFSALDPMDPTKFITVPGLNIDAPDVAIATPYQFDFLDGVVISDVKDPKAKPYTLPVQVYGQVFKGAVPFFNPYRSNDLTIPKDAFKNMGFRIDNTRKILIADRHLYNIDSTTPTSPKAIPPDLFCIVSCHVRDKNGALVRYKRGQNLDPRANTPALQIIKEDCQMVRMANWDNGSQGNQWTITNMFDNTAAVNVPMDYYLASEIQTIIPKDSQTLSYPGIIPCDPDGAIAQISWRFGGLSQCITTASLNSEHMFWRPSYEFVRFQQRLKQFVDRPDLFLTKNLNDAGGVINLNPQPIRAV